MALFEGTSLSEKGIRSLIRLRGGLPPEHRFTAWKYLLRLPSNSEAFAQQIAKGPHHTAMASLAMRYPLRDRKHFRKTAILVSALAHWSPILADVEFVPSWVFPFVVVFSQVRYIQSWDNRAFSQNIKITVFVRHTTLHPAPYECLAGRA